MLQYPYRGPPNAALNLQNSHILTQHHEVEVMLRNLPNNYSRDMLLTMLDKRGFTGRGGGAECRVGLGYRISDSGFWTMYCSTWRVRWT